MTIIVFMIDTSASMNQRSYIGARPTLLDMAKGAVENFVKLRQRNPDSRFDRYMLFTSEETPLNLKAGWKENLATFMNELKNIRSTGLSTLGPSLKNVFDVLNVNRVQSGIDTYGSGRSPFYLEPALIICITDGGKLSSSQGVQDDIFPISKSNPIPGAELTKEVFRWDQRLYGLVLRLTGTPIPDTMGVIPSDNSPLDKLCELTGGRTYAVRTHRMFQQCVENLVLRVHSGVVINFEKIGPDPPPIADGGRDTMEYSETDPTSDVPPIIPTEPVQQVGPPNGTNNISSTDWHQSRKMIYVPKPLVRGQHNCFWPIPESYWPDVSLITLPARTAHPNVKFSCTSQEPLVLDNLPFDKYELEQSPLTRFILSRKQPNICWQVFIPNSSKNSDVGLPFGYLKASTTKASVNLFVMPYNYPVLYSLLEDYFKIHRNKPTKEWRQLFDNYLRATPTYYIGPLRKALDRMGILNLITDKYDSPFTFQVANSNKKLKALAKIEYDKLCAEVEKRVNQNNGFTYTTRGYGSQEGYRVLSRARPLPRHLTSNHLLQDKLSENKTEYANFTIAVRKYDIQPQAYRNAFDIPRSNLIDQLTRMRANFLQRGATQLYMDKGPDQMHCKPINQMGNYQDYLKKINPPLRELESAPVRQHMFGNPFKIDKKMSMMVDEADDFAQPGVPNKAVKRTFSDAHLYPPNKNPKRKKGPLSADFSLEHLVSPPPSPSPPTPPPIAFSTPSYSPQPYRHNCELPTPVEEPLPNGLHTPLVNGDISASDSSAQEESESDTELEIDMDAEDKPPDGANPNIKVEQRNGILPHPELVETEHLDYEEIRKRNRDILMKCYKEVKRPGRDFRALKNFLSDLQGTIEIQLKVVSKVINEALRFKRHSVVEYLNCHLELLQNSSHGLTNGFRR